MHFESSHELHAGSADVLVRMRRGAKCFVRLKAILSRFALSVDGTSALPAECGFLILKVHQCLALRRSPPAAAAWRFNPHAIADFHFPASFRSQLFFFPIAANDVSAAALSVFAALQSVRSAFAAIGK